jgi:hypothetical protein
MKLRQHKHTLVHSDLRVNSENAEKWRTHYMWNTENAEKWRTHYKSNNMHLREATQVKIAAGAQIRSYNIILLRKTCPELEAMQWPWVRRWTASTNWTLHKRAKHENQSADPFQHESMLFMPNNTARGYAYTPCRGNSKSSCRTRSNLPSQWPLQPQEWS